MQAVRRESPVGAGREFQAGRRPRGMSATTVRSRKRRSTSAPSGQLPGTVQFQATLLDDSRWNTSFHNVSKLGALFRSEMPEWNNV
jgi:hypothetical protein